MRALSTAAHIQTSFPEAVISTYYSAFGLTIRSELPLPEFCRLPGRRPGSVDVEISLADQGRNSGAEASAPSCTVGLREAHFWFEGVGGFDVTDGSRIRIRRHPAADDALLRMYVEGMMMATILFQRGHIVLHASVVQIGEKCAAFLGHVGAGKSSVAAALHVRGHGVVSDDNAAIDFSGGQPAVLPAFPYVKVFRSIAQSLGVPDGSLTVMHSSQPKCARGVRAGFPRAPVTLDRIYVLSRGEEHDLRTLSKRDATIELVRNSVPIRWKLPGGPEHLAQCAALAAHIPAFRIRTFDALGELPMLAKSIERHSP